MLSYVTSVPAVGMKPSMVIEVIVAVSPVMSPRSWSCNLSDPVSLSPSGDTATGPAMLSTVTPLPHK